MSIIELIYFSIGLIVACLDVYLTSKYTANGFNNLFLSGLMFLVVVFLWPIYLSVCAAGLLVRFIVKKVK
ncbi:TMhelix containing protein [Vibrio phage 1.263.B._10N.286.51.B1]|nr:TMhelix containing protein [Vibrio phage 1.263.A._10N.286.51.B1]AUR99278.1 TMhelix containing protein [Vibrio phage 1.263.B._10N.286.51.B1]